MLKKFSFVFSLTVLLALSAPVHAQGWEHRHERDWHGGSDHRPQIVFDFEHFDHESWHRGRWSHEWHDGRLGWWWISGGAWYFYPSPVYPYPDPFTPPGIVVETAPSAQPSAWYCSNPMGYYPSVPLCYSAWQRVVGGVIVQQAAPVVVPQQPVVVQQQPTQYIQQAPATQSQPATSAPVVSSKEIDARQLKDYESEFGEIHRDTTSAVTKLKDLAKRVEYFRKSLLSKDYNAMELLRNVEDLKKEIADKIALFSKH